jgi:hypothetical protein
MFNKLDSQLYKYFVNEQNFLKSYLNKKKEEIKIANINLKRAKENKTVFVEIVKNYIAFNNNNVISNTKNVITTDNYAYEYETYDEIFENQIKAIELLVEFYKNQLELYKNQVEYIINKPEYKKLADTRDNEIREYKLEIYESDINIIQAKINLAQSYIAAAKSHIIVFPEIVKTLIIEPIRSNVIKDIIQIIKFIIKSVIEICKHPKPNKIERVFAKISVNRHKAYLGKYVKEQEYIYNELKHAYSSNAYPEIIAIFESRLNLAKSRVDAVIVNIKKIETAGI